MSTHILSYHGDRDAIRYGCIGFGIEKRSFRWDRLSCSVRLFNAGSGICIDVEEDTDPHRLSRALSALLAREPIHG